MRAMRRFAELILFSSLFASSFGQGTWQRTQNIPAASLGMTFLLQDGTILAHHQESPDWYKLTPDAFGNYQKGTWAKMASTQSDYGPLYYASAVLPDGRVVVTGGEYNLSGGGVWTNKGAIYQPLTNTWQVLNAPSGWSNIGDSQCVVMPDGTFVLANFADKRMAKLDASTLTWTSLAGANKSDRFDEEGWILMPNGNILTLCALNAPNGEQYVPALDRWLPTAATPQSLEDQNSQELGPMVLLPSGKVFAMGATGHNAIFTPGATTTDPGTWVSAPDFPVSGNGQLDIADGPGCLLPNGNVLCYASPGVFNTPSSFFEFDGTSFIGVPNLPNSASHPSYVGTMLVLPDGKVMFTDFSQDVEIYTPTGAPQDAWRPTISAAPNAVSPGSTNTINGTQFNGLSQCNSYGDDSSNAGNYPLVRITNTATGHVFYCRTFNPSTMGVATGSTPVSASFTVPTGIELGASKIEVVCNGIPSAKRDITIGNGALTSLSLNPSTVSAGSSVTGTVSIDTGLPSSQTITLSDNGVELNTPASATILANQTSATFSISTVDTGVTVTRTVTAVLGTVTKTANLTITAVTIINAGITPANVVGGNPASERVTLSGPAPAGYVLTVRDTDSRTNVPATVTVPEGATFVDFDITSQGTPVQFTSEIRVSRLRQTFKRYLVVYASALSTFSIAPTIVTGGTSATGTITLNGKAFAAGIYVNVSSDGPEATVPATVGFGQNVSQKTFEIKTKPVAVRVIRTITVSYNGVTKTKTLTINH